ncbi:MAG: peroxiredoxin [Rhodocyclaceae bacterium]|nr:peroxiredoxin [Rhodocyclaceae bacterium]
MATWLGLLMAMLSPFPAAANALLQAGEMAPDFLLADGAGRMRQLGEWRGTWLILYFYPRDDTPGCTTEAKAFNDRQPELAALKAQVLGISVDSSDSHRAFASRLGLNFPLLADTDGQVSRRYGALSDFAIVKFAKRHTFLIDPEGRIAKAYRDVEPSRHAGEIIADLKQLRAK